MDRLRFKWTVEFDVDELWVQDGFDFNESWIQKLEEELLPWSTEGDVKVKVLSAPDPEAIRKAQGGE